ncbi:MFS transporter [Hirschia litorea]|uniref:MFS transporter n=1 Tax=Hirschia litorea TaxID=1199156 RepID=A0ABW2IKG9_9PROT
MNVTDTNNISYIDNTKVYLGAGFLAGAGALMFGVMPIFLSLIGGTFELTPQQVGDAAAAFNASFTGMSISALFWIRKIDWRATSLIGLLISIIGTGLFLAINSYLHLLSAMFLTGIGMGLLYSLSMTVLGDSERPQKAFAVKLGMETFPGAIVLFAAPVFILPKAGFTGFIGVMLMALLLLGFGALGIPKQDNTRRDLDKFYPAENSGNLLLILISVVISLTFFSGMMGSWAFLEFLGSDREISGSIIGATLSIGLIAMGLGGFLAAILSNKASQTIQFIIIATVHLVALAILAFVPGTAGFAAGSILFLFTVNYILSFTFGLTARLDKQGRFVALCGASLSGGAVLGPMVSGRLIESQGYTGMLTFSAICLIVAAFIFVTLSQLKASK